MSAIISTWTGVFFDFGHNLGICDAYRNRNTNKSVLVRIKTNKIPKQHVPIFFRPSIELNLEGWIIIIIINDYDDDDYYYNYN